MDIKQDNRGGSRPGAGRKPVPYKSVILTIRVPEPLKNKVKRDVKRIITDWKAANS
jgi:hypothetical protein